MPSRKKSPLKSPQQSTIIIQEDIIIQKPQQFCGILCLQA